VPAGPHKGRENLRVLDKGVLVIDTSAGSLTVNAAKLTPPEVVYDADRAWIEHTPGTVSLLFAKLDRDDPHRYRSRLEVRYAPEKLPLTFWKSSVEWA
jgi:hypothetical protein